jgi:Flp pilus assembly CpaF family ATPase
MQFKKLKENTHVEHFHCVCGQVPLTAAKFRCKDVDLHDPDEFIQFPPAALADQLLYYGEKNLLILGETGVGKSTWINAFANFITHGTLDEAIQVSLKAIHMKFIIQSDK